MPIYDYLCTACGKVSEFIQKFNSAPKVTCPECKENALLKRITAASFRLRGAGWYQTDFKDKK